MCQTYWMMTDSSKSGKLGSISVQYPNDANMNQIRPPFPPSAKRSLSPIGTIQTRSSHYAFSQFPACRVRQNGKH
jgi:hypothetical protein